MSCAKPSFLLLVLLIIFGSVCAVLYTPALPAIAHYFAVSDNAAGLTITLYLIGYALGPLLYGPLANRYGRKMALYIGISLAVLAALFCSLAAWLHSFNLMLFARFAMALGASVGLKMSFTLVADTYSADQSRKVVAHLLVAAAITPSIGVAIGGCLTQYLSWQSCFYFLALYGGFILWLCSRIHETAETLDKEALQFSKIVSKYGRLLKNMRLVTASSLMGCGTTLVYVFAALAPFVAIVQMDLSPSLYSAWNLIPPVGLLLGSQVSGRLTKHWSQLRTIIVGIVVIFLAGLAMLLAFLGKGFSSVVLFTLMGGINFGAAFIYANASVLATSEIEDKANASALMNFINMGTATVIVLLLGLLHSALHILLPVILVAVAGLALLISMLLRIELKSH